MVERRRFCEAYQLSCQFFSDTSKIYNQLGCPFNYQFEGVHLIRCQSVPSQPQAIWHHREACGKHKPCVPKERCIKKCWVHNNHQQSASTLLWPTGVGLIIVLAVLQFFIKTRSVSLRSEGGRQIVDVRNVKPT